MRKGNVSVGEEFVKLTHRLYFVFLFSIFLSVCACAQDKPSTLSAPARWASTVDEQYLIYPDVTYGVANNYTLKLDVWQRKDAKTPTPTLIYYHGGGWIWGDRTGATLFFLPYLEMGVTTYSSAIFNFVPNFANTFYAAVRGRDRETVYRMLKEFVLPYISIRNRRKGYAVSIVKAGMTALGRSAGAVRSPLTDLTPEDFDALKVLIGDRN